MGVEDGRVHCSTLSQWRARTRKWVRVERGQQARLAGHDAGVDRADEADRADSEPEYAGDDAGVAAGVVAVGCWRCRVGGGIGHVGADVAPGRCGYGGREALRPALTRAAYRYRGTEKTSVDQQFQDAAALSGHGDADRVAISALTDPKAAGKTLSGS